MYNKKKNIMPAKGIKLDIKNGKISYIHGSAELILLKYAYYSKLSI